MPAEVYECPKGWGRVIFGEGNRCPISGVSNCTRCEAGAKEPKYESEWKKLKQGKTE